MSKKANPTTVGLFMIVGLALGVIALIIVSSGNLFSTRQKFILYFDASLKGLSQGAPVKYRGVNIGSVTEILIHHNQASNDFSLPVIVEINQKSLHEKSDQQTDLSSRENYERMIDMGLRGRLDTDSLVTGVLYIGLEIYTNAGPPVFHQLKPEYKEIPTIPTQVQQLLANLAKLDLTGIADKLNSVLARLDSDLNELKVKQINGELTNLLSSVNRVVGSPEVTNTIVSLHRSLDDFNKLVTKLDRQVDPMAASVTNTLQQAQATLGQLQGSLQNLNNVIGPDSPVQNDLALALGQMAEAARAVGSLSEFLQRHPNALITGRKPQQLKP